MRREVPIPVAPEFSWLLMIPKLADEISDAGLP